jgi:2-(1,2-epoxy-1,2-dihydrophenyl)acetyl-CoA isomerase
MDPSEPRYDAGHALDTHYNPLMRTIRDLPIPIVAALNGAAAGIGCSIALACDIIVAGESGYLIQAFRRIGLVPDGGSAFLLTKATGRLRASEMMLLGDKIPAAKALEWGLVNDVVPDSKLRAAALAVAEKLAGGPTLALAMIRQLTWAAGDLDFEGVLALERRLQRSAGRTADHREGVAAFFEKRQARFSCL